MRMHRPGAKQQCDTHYQAENHESGPIENPQLDVYGKRRSKDHFDGFGGPINESNIESPARNGSQTNKSHPTLPAANARSDR